jgi:phospholipase/carboxylesterase
MKRREFLLWSAVAGIESLIGCSTNLATLPGTSAGRLRSRPAAPETIASPGLQSLDLGVFRDALLYVPRGHTVQEPLPLLVLLHGAGARASAWFGSYGERADAARIVVLAPDSRSATWDLVRGSYGPDVAFMDEALAATFRKCSIDPSRIAIGGFSDGASYALALGTTNGDLFKRIVAFSPGFLRMKDRIGAPSIFVSHGTDDQILSIESTSRPIVARLRTAGYQTEYLEFAGGHTVPPAVSDAAVRWLTVR